MIFEFCPTFWECAQQWASPIVQDKANIMMNLNICEWGGIGGGGF
jgi:hypothetical protein